MCVCFQKDSIQVFINDHKPVYHGKDISGTEITIKLIQWNPKSLQGVGEIKPYVEIRKSTDKNRDLNCVEIRKKICYFSLNKRTIKFYDEPNSNIFTVKISKNYEKLEIVTNIIEKHIGTLNLQSTT